jgi:hypothetical protein
MTIRNKLFVALGALPILACTASISGESTEGSGGGGTGAAPGAGGGGPKPPDQMEGCSGWEVAMPKRLIRLSFNQLATSLRPILGDAFADQSITKYDIADPTERTFPPLGDTREGSSYIDAKWQTADSIAQDIGQYAVDNFATFTGCTDAPTTECAQAFILSLAEKAFRHPLSDAEKSSLTQVYTEQQTAGSTIQESLRFAVYAIFSSPSFLYRTEFGTTLTEEGPLTPYEVASQISYFVTDGPPDQALLDAASSNELSSPEQIAPHVDRLLATSSAKVNLQSAILASVSISSVLSVVIDPEKVPGTDFNAGVAASMYHETELFVKDVLWNGGKVSDLVTSRKSFIDKNVANLYGIPAPTTGLDADGFGLVELPANRAGLLTMPALLTARSRPDHASVVGRGLLVNDAILCQQNPAFPEDLASQIESVTAGQTNLSEREKADYRSSTPPCMGCHMSFDPYGVALENYDLIGKFRTTDEQGRPIDASVTLPDLAGGGTAADAVAVGQALATSGAFSSCVATKLLTYALAETGVKGDSCASKVIADSFKNSDQSFSALVKAVAISKTLTHRSGG